MRTDRTKPDLTFVSVIHQALRADGARIVETADRVADVPAGTAGRPDDPRHIGECQLERNLDPHR
jgi:hypothetical protein